MIRPSSQHRQADNFVHHYLVVSLFIQNSLSDTMAISYVMTLMILCLSLTLAQTVQPDPTFDCSNPNFRVIYTACSAGDYAKCCAAGTSCCAGGCCDLLSNCLNVGTANEACCPADSPDACGQYKSGTTPPYAVQSIVCEGSDGLSSYFCPPGAQCELDGDTCSGGSGGSGGGGSGGGGGGAASSSTILEVSSQASSTAPSSTVEGGGGGGGGDNGGSGNGGGGSTQGGTTSSPAGTPRITVEETATVDTSGSGSEETTAAGGPAGGDTTSQNTVSPSPTSTQEAGPVTVTVVPSSTGQPSAATRNREVGLLTIYQLGGLIFASLILVYFL